MTRPVASLSLDLDNLWAYQMTHGDPGWEAHPSYLERCVPLALGMLADLGLTITFFIVGIDAAEAPDRAVLREIAARGHEIGNHSWSHRPWLHRMGPDEVRHEIAGAHDAIRDATGSEPRGFRGPGYSLSPTVLDTLGGLGYTYDCSTLPTVIGPLARAYYFRTARLDPGESEDRELLFGSWTEGTRPLGPYRWQVDGGHLVEVPVTTFPGFRIPIHISYLLYLDGMHPALAAAYFRAALAACRAAGVTPSLLLHPLDFVGSDDIAGLEFFPGMGMEGARKRARVVRLLSVLAERFEVVPVGAHAARADARPLAAWDTAFAAPDTSVGGALRRTRQRWRDGHGHG